MSMIKDYQNHEESMLQAKSDIIDDLSKKDFIVFAGAGLSESTKTTLKTKIFHIFLPNYKHKFFPCHRLQPGIKSNLLEL